MGIGVGTRGAPGARAPLEIKALKVPRPPLPLKIELFGKPISALCM